MNKKTKKKSNSKTPSKKSIISSNVDSENIKTGTKKKGNQTKDLNSQDSFTFQEERKVKEKKNKHKNRKKTSEQIPEQATNRYKSREDMLKSNAIKGTWTPSEDRLLRDWVNKNGPRNWTKCSEIIKGRSGKQCREHWNNSLNPDVIKGNWTKEEDFLIMYFYKKCDGSWKKIIYLFNRRTENSIKNRFFSQLRKIAASKLDAEEKRECSKIKLSSLLNYLDIATCNAKKTFLEENPKTEEELKEYLIEIEQRIIKGKNNKKHNKEKKEEENDENNFGFKRRISKKFLKKRNRTDESKELKEENNTDHIFKKPSTHINNSNVNKELKIDENKNIQTFNLKINDLDPSYQNKLIQNQSNQIDRLNSSSTLNYLNNLNQQNSQNKIKKELSKLYTINRNIPQGPEEILVPQTCISTYENKIKTNTSVNLPSFSSNNISNNNNNPIINSNIFNNNLNISNNYLRWISKPSSFDCQNSNFLKTKPSFDPVNGCYVFDNENELNHNNFEKKKSFQKNHNNS